MSEQEFIDIFADNLRSLMYEVGISQNELAKEIGVDKSVISRYLNKQTMPSIKNFLNICYVLECDTRELFEPYDLIH
jgi:transcriptional regulator with XRE-family HTH domain